ncbi:MAG TPA: pilus assembly protein PilM, partial [Vulgatibacter sp.]|nr:pilus assembly protein PilM [Vulgatibacter sp.]
GVPVERLEKLPGDAQGRIPPELQGPLAHAFGLALRGMARGRSVNLRKGPFAFKGDLDFLKGKVGRLVAFAAVLVLLVAGNVWMRTNTLRAEEEALDRALCEQTQKVLGTCETDFNLALSKLQGGDTKASQIPTASALEVFGVVTDVLPGIELRMDEIDATLERLRVRGTVDSFDAVDQVVAAMKKSRCVGDVRPGRVQKNRDEKIEFTLDALYVCGQGAQG